MFRFVNPHTLIKQTCLLVCVYHKTTLLTSPVRVAVINAASELSKTTFFQDRLIFGFPNTLWCTYSINAQGPKF